MPRLVPLTRKASGSEEYQDVEESGKEGEGEAEDVREALPLPAAEKLTFAVPLPEPEKDGVEEEVDVLVTPIEPAILIVELVGAAVTLAVTVEELEEAGVLDVVKEPVTLEVLVCDAVQLPARLIVAVLLAELEPEPVGVGEFEGEATLPSCSSGSCVNPVMTGGSYDSREGREGIPLMEMEGMYPAPAPSGEVHARLLPPSVGEIQAISLGVPSPPSRTTE